MSLFIHRHVRSLEVKNLQSNPKIYISFQLKSEGSVCTKDEEY